MNRSAFFPMLGFPVVLVLVLQTSGRGEDYSPAFGIAVTALGAFSDGRGFGGGVEVTANAMLFNASLEGVFYQDDYHDRQNTVSGFVGLGGLNPVMVQVGGGSDGFAARLHGELAVVSLFNGGYGIYPSHNGFGTPRQDVIVSYSFGYQESGTFGSMGVGVVF